MVSISSIQHACAILVGCVHWKYPVCAVLMQLKQLPVVVLELAQECSSPNPTNNATAYNY